MRLFIDLLLGLVGLFLSWGAISLLGKEQLNWSDKLLAYLIGGTSFVFFIIFGLLDFSTKEGPALDLGWFQISYGISESLLWLLIVIAPLVLSITLIIFLKKHRWLQRAGVPILLLAAVMSLNTFQTFRELEQHHWDHEIPAAICDESASSFDPYPCRIID